MIIRFRGRHGNYRVNASEDTPLAAVIADVEAQLPPHGPLALSASPAAQGESANKMWELPVAKLGIKHGDMFFISYEDPQASAPAPPTAQTTTYMGDELDQQLASKQGRIGRPQTSLCTHGPKGMCEYCQPLEPWDEGYQQEHGIKHTSFHAWRRKTKEEGGTLEEPDFRVKPNCRQGHAPWPASFCSKCQPPAITLQRQKFRMVDHVEFESPKIVEQFIEFWRQTNQQRLGFLIGKYASYEEHVPLGIKAEVHAIWEPQQIDDIDTLLLQELPTAGVAHAAKMLGLEVLGVVFTDLTDLGDGSGKVITKRHLNSYFLSSLEIVFGARLQNQYPHYLSSDDAVFGTAQGPMKSQGPLRFSSRFVTCCISGNEFGDIDVACYQASAQAEALVQADLVVPSTNPAVMRIQPPSDTRYVPDVSYRRINEYKLTVTEDAKPAFPVDYLLVSLSHGFKTQTVADLAGGASFTVENRPAIRGQTPSQLADWLQLSSGINTEGLTDFHALLYLLSLGVLQSEDIDVLIGLLRAKGDQRTDLAVQLTSGPGMNTLRMLAS